MRVQEQCAHGRGQVERKSRPPNRTFAKFATGDAEGRKGIACLLTGEPTACRHGSGASFSPLWSVLRTPCSVGMSGYLNDQFD
jgi:hypothetical protein